ncbi:MAG: hypothetical protein U0T77_02065 [Chitinophagales bacterium]
MTLLFKIRHFFFTIFLKLNRSIIKEHRPVSLLNANRIGILFFADDMHSNDILLAFCQKLKDAGKEVVLLGYIPKREFGFAYPFPLITNKDVNWYGKPTGSNPESILHSPLDLLINFHTEYCLPFEFLCATSSAKFRVGFRPDSTIANYDLILIPKENKEISNLIQNLENYLK